jgi:hypothetical protein
LPQKKALGGQPDNLLPGLSELATYKAGSELQMSKEGKPPNLH